MTYWQQILKDELDVRKERNHSYSLRSFAQSLDLSPAQLSQLLSGKRTITRKMADKLSEKLMLTSFEKEKFIYSTLSISKEKNAHNELMQDEFALISDWYHFAILGLAEIKSSKASPLWIAKRLGITHDEAKEAVDRLLRLRIIEIRNGKVFQIKKNLKSTTDIPSSAIRKHHRQNLKKASEKLEDVDVSLREFTSITLAIDPKNIKEAKELINDFKRKLGSLLEQGTTKEVYTFSAQLFPVSLQESKT